MNNTPQTIMMKIFNPVICPKCKDEFYVALHYAVPIITGSFTMEESNKAKEELKKRIEGISPNDSPHKTRLLSMINNNPVNPADVEELIQDFIKKENEQNKGGKL